MRPAPPYPPRELLDLSPYWAAAAIQKRWDQRQYAHAQDSLGVDVLRLAAHPDDYLRHTRDGIRRKLAAVAPERLVLVARERVFLSPGLPEFGADGLDGRELSTDDITDLTADPRTWATEANATFGGRWAGLRLVFHLEAITLPALNPETM